MTARRLNNGKEQIGNGRSTLHLSNYDKLSRNDLLLISGSFSRTGMSKRKMVFRPLPEAVLAKLSEDGKRVYKAIAANPTQIRVARAADEISVEIEKNNKILIKAINANKKR